MKIRPGENTEKGEIESKVENAFREIIAGEKNIPGNNKNNRYKEINQGNEQQNAGQKKIIAGEKDTPGNNKNNRNKESNQGNEKQKSL